MKNQFIRKSLLALGTSVAFATIALAADGPNTPMLDVVPADTAFFSASIEAFPIKTYMEVNKEIFQSMSGEDNPVTDKFNDDDSVSKFFGHIVKDYYENAGNASELLGHYGIGDMTRAAIYTVGFNPVLRYEATNPMAVYALFDAAAKKAGAAVAEKEMNGVTYKTYHPDTENPLTPNLIIAVSGNWVTITLGHPGTNNSHLKVALGVEKPAKSINDTTILADIVAKYGFEGTQLGYIDHQIILNRLLDSNPIEFIDKDDWDDMAEIRTPECKAEFSAIAASWPRTVIGEDNITITPTEYSASSKIIIESTNAATNAALMDLRGFIPAHARGIGGKMFSLAFGINANKMTGALTKIWSGVTQAEYKCEPLIEIQKNWVEANPAALGMFAGMAQGIMGISATIYSGDIDMSNGKPMSKDLDALISLASENPAQQLATGAMMLPPLAAIKLLEDGTPIELNQVVPLVNMIGGKTMAAAVGKHINVYQGGKAAEASAAMTNEGIDANGFFALTMHYTEYFKLMSKILKLSDEPLQLEFKGLEDSNMQISMEVDFTEHGIEIVADVEMKK